MSLELDLAPILTAGLITALVMFILALWSAPQHKPMD